MATIKLGTTKAGAKLINYAEKRAEVQQGVNCSDTYAKTQMKATRAMWGKTDGIQAHHVIQSFKPGEVTSKKANEIGKELAEKVARGHECAVYTHTDKNHTHNHIVINSVNYENGKKFRAHGQKAIDQIREASDDLCKQRDLSVVQEKSAEVRHTLAEQELIEKGRSSWKDEIRQAIDKAKEQSTDMDSFKKRLKDVYGVEMKLRGKTLSYKHPERERFVRAKKLGDNYDIGGLQHEFARQTERKQEYERTISGDERTQRFDAQLHSGSDERSQRQRHDRSESTGEYQSQQQPNHEQHAINLEQARTIARKKRRTLSRDFDDWIQGNTSKQQADNRRTEQSKSKQHERTAEHQQEHGKANERNREQDKEPVRRHKQRSQGLEL